MLCNNHLINNNKYDDDNYFICKLIIVDTDMCLSRNAYHIHKRIISKISFNRH